MPPVASTTARARTAPTPSRSPSPMTCSVTPQAAPAASRSRSRTSACSITSTPVADSTRASRARSISAPVASPPACAMRSRRWPPSRVSDSCPSRDRSKRAPIEASSRTAAAPSRTRTRTAVSSQTPAPATIVSAKCCSGRVAGAERRGDAALGPPRRPGGQHVLGHQQDAQRRLAGDLQRGRQPGDAGADDRPRRSRCASPAPARATGGKPATADDLGHIVSLEQQVQDHDVEIGGRH